MKIIVFLGAPGSGKGTQSKQLVTEHGFIHFSTGDMLRAAIKEQKPVGLKAKLFMDKGELVPDQVMIALIEEAMSPLSSDAKIILDGFPRTEPQAVALDANPKTKVDKAIYFLVPDAVLIGRLTGRRICASCGESFHLIFVPPKKAGVCDKCGSSLTQRPDDSEEVAVKRLQVFKNKTIGLIQYYQNQTKLVGIPADKDINYIQSKLLEYISD